MIGIIYLNAAVGAVITMVFIAPVFVLARLDVVGYLLDDFVDYWKIGGNPWVQIACLILRLILTYIEVIEGQRVV